MAEQTGQKLYSLSMLVMLLFIQLTQPWFMQQQVAEFQAVGFIFHLMEE
jgi:hypothetical protein